MSLHTLANHMSAHGRGPDTTLVHMSPREVHGLQALAMAHGGSLTINPHTGLPEAGFLENLLPAIAGFALNAFAPGVGGAVGSALGLTGAAASTVGSGLLIGGATSLFTGSLEKGLMAGLGAYGGAGLGSSLSGAPSATMDAASGARDAGMSAAAEVSPSATAARLQSGVNTAMSAPVDFMKDNVFNFGLASAPLLAGTFDDQQTSNAPKRQSGNLYRYKKDPVTGQSYAYETYSGDDVKNAPPMVWGNASGGLMQHYDAGGPVRYGNVGDPVDINGNPILPSTKDTRSDSERAQDYLMGVPGATNPFLFYHKDAAPVVPIKKAAEATSSLEEEFAKNKTSGGRGLSFEAQDIKNSQDAWANLTDDQKSDYYIDNPGMLGFSEGALNLWSKTPIGMIQNYFDPSRQNTQRKIMESARGAIHARSFKKPPEYSPIPTQTIEQAEFNRLNFGIPLGQPPGAIFDIDDFGENPDGSPSFVKPDLTSDAATQNAIAEANRESNAIQESRSNYGGYSGVSPGGYSNSLTDHTDNGDHSGSMAARGGFLNNGRFDQRYAYGGGITALAQGGYNLGSYSDGGRLLRGPGDGVSDDIPATIGQNQPARLADGEFVVPARIVSELGNGSTEAGARKLYAMMDRVQKSRSKTTGKDKVAANSRADKYLPA